MRSFDRATVLGLVIGLAFIGGAVYFGPTRSAFFDLPSIAIVLGGTLATTLIRFPLPIIATTLPVVRQAFMEKLESPVALVQTLSKLADLVRRESLLALEKQKIEDRFLKRAVDLCLEGAAPDVIESTLRSELASVLERHERGQRIFRGMGQSAPAFGMIGTLIGLVQMLTLMDDPSKIGGSMAIAILTTFYGALLAYLVFNPIADKLGERSRQELKNNEIVLYGILSIMAGHHPRMVERRLHVMLEPVAVRKLTSVRPLRRAA